MFREKLTENTSKSSLLKWWFLCFLAGQVNAGGLMATGRFVSHVTGFATLFGVELANGYGLAALGMISVPLFFLLGTMIAGMLVEARILRGIQPRFDLVMLIVTSCFAICTIGGYLGWLGPFGRTDQLSGDYGVMALLCLASGLQNAAISSSSAGTVKVTHLTGLTTDMGIGWVKWWTLRLIKDSNAKRELVMNEFRLGMILSFASGSAIATIFFLHYQYLGFLLPTFCAFYAMIEAQKIKT